MQTNVLDSTSLRGTGRPHETGTGRGLSFVRPWHCASTVLLWGLVILGWMALGERPAQAQDPANYFRQNCMSCHTVGGGRLVGPDLKDVTKRKERDWLLRFVSNPKQMLDSGDPYAAQLREDARGVVMPTIPGLTGEVAGTVLDLIERESALEKSQFAGLQITDEPFGAADVERGRQIFSGGLSLANGGPACNSCHSTSDLGIVGGGKLGPDLTRVYERMLGRKNLASWLLAPATATMRPTFQNRALTTDEIQVLVAYLENVARKGGSENSAPQLTIFLLGLLGAALMLAFVDAMWVHRFRTVRRRLVGERA